MERIVGFADVLIVRNADGGRKQCTPAFYTKMGPSAVIEPSLTRYGHKRNSMTSRVDDAFLW
jgi:hypothetical protein